MKSLGLLAVLLFPAVIIFMYKYWGGDARLTYSQNAARHQSSIVYYAIALPIIIAILSIFMIGWFIPHWQLGRLFLTVYCLGALGETVAALVPELPGGRATIHIWSTTVMYVATLLMTATLFLASHASLLERVAAGIGFLAMLLVAGLLGKHKGNHPQATLLQSVHLAAFFAILMIFTYQ